MSKFRVGDRVKFVGADNSGEYFLQGQVGKVIGHSSHGTLVEFDDCTNERLHDGNSLIDAAYDDGRNTCWYCQEGNLIPAPADTVDPLDDLELSIIAAVYRLDEDARVRVIEYLGDRFEVFI